MLQHRYHHLVARLQARLGEAARDEVQGFGRAPREDHLAGGPSAEEALNVRPCLFVGARCALREGVEGTSRAGEARPLRAGDRIDHRAGQEACGGGVQVHLPRAIRARREGGEVRPNGCWVVLGHGDRLGYECQQKDPMSSPVDADDVLAYLKLWLEEGRTLSLATLVRAHGSAPRPVGSRLLVDAAGNFVGSVSGGCVESAAVAAGAQVMAGAPPHLLQVGVSDDDAFALGLACGGALEVFIEPVRDEPAWQALFAARESKRSVVWLTWLSHGQHCLFDPAAEADHALSPALVEAARSALARDRAVLATSTEGDVFVCPVAPRLRMIIIGAVHIAQALVQMAELAGFEVWVVDPRGAYATEARFPEARLVRAWPDEALGKLGVDRRTAVVALSHDPKLDDPALACALSGGAFYVGALGSRRSHAKRLERLSALGVPLSERALVHGPVGLDIGAQSAGEIASSIVAQAVKVLRQGAA